MIFSHGDRVRWEATAADGLPLVRYGFVRSMTDATGPVVVLFDDELSGEVIDVGELAPVTITSIELRLEGDDLLDDPDLRRGLTSLWKGEAESAGMDVEDLRPHGYGDHDGNGGWHLASLTSGDHRYTVKAFHHRGHIVVHAEHFNGGSLPAV